MSGQGISQKVPENPFPKQENSDNCSTKSYLNEDCAHSIHNVQKQTLSEAI